jgi:general secretion pathway protein K
MSALERKPWRHGYVDLDAARARARKPSRARHAARHAERNGAPRVPSRSLPRAQSAALDERKRRSGIALVVVMTVITMLTVLVAELLQNTTTAFQVATGERDRLRAEYLAKSGLNLTRLLIAKEPQIRAVISPFYQMAVRRAPPQLNVWDFADMLLAPFASSEDTESLGAETGIDFSLMEGLKETHGTFEVITVPENGKINVNKPLFFAGDDARKSTAQQLYALMGGLQSPESPYDIMFSQRDADGLYTTRLDIVSALIDWWDFDQERTVYDPGAGAVTAGGSEDDAYSQLKDPYVVKNAPYDSIEELRMVRGVGDDFWATFVEGEPDDPRTRLLTIYGSGAVNVNEAPPAVLLHRLCSYVPEQAMCRDPLQAASFVQLLTTAKAMLPIALFSTVDDFINFVTGSPGKGLDLFAELQVYAAGTPLMLWTPMTITADQRKQMAGRFLVAASIFTLQSIGRVGRARAKMTMTVNFDTAWQPPPGVLIAQRPPLGAVHYYRLE